MPLAVCPFCPSGASWNACSCRWAIEAQRFGMMATRGRWQEANASGKPAPIPPASPTNAKGAASRAAPKGSANRPREAALPRASLPDAIKKAAQLYAPPGECAVCDRRRTYQRDLMRTRRAKQKEPTP